ncbi:MAG: EAL domain-containing protein [Pseudomonadales bacterium]
MKRSKKPHALNAAIEQSDYAVVITTAELDPPGPTIVHVNTAMQNMTGYTRGELLGATPRILQGPDTDRVVLDRLVANLRAGDSFEGCTWNYKKDGTPYLVEWTITRMHVKDEDVDYFLSVQREVTEQHPPQEQIHRHIRQLNAMLNSAGSNHETSTGALNHRGMLLRLQRLIDDPAPTYSLIGLVALQIKRLDRVDQAFGFDAVNQLICDIVEHLESQLVAGESLARSHEYTLSIIIPVDADVADPELHLMTRAQAFVAAVRDEDFDVDGNALRVEVSAGISCAPTNSNDAHELVTLSDEAAQRAPKEDVIPIRWANHSIKDAKRQEIKFEGELELAVTDRELVLFYQPILDLSCDEVVGAEALLRWPQPAGHAPIGPDQFIPVAEELGFMERLGTQVFEDACRQLKCWQELPSNGAFWVSVNVAPVQLCDPGLAERFLAITQATGVSPSCVKLEITEKALEQDLDQINTVLDELVSAGFNLALDDFGIGYSTLARIIDIPFNIIKVDRTFVRQTPDGRGAGVVASLSQLSKYLEVDALGEGVETVAHETFLRDCNYRYAQGFYYAKPMASADFTVWMGWPAE